MTWVLSCISHCLMITWFILAPLACDPSYLLLIWWCLSVSLPRLCSLDGYLLIFGTFLRLPKNLNSLSERAKVDNIMTICYYFSPSPTKNNFLTTAFHFLSVVLNSHFGKFWVLIYASVCCLSCFVSHYIPTNNAWEIK